MRECPKCGHEDLECWRHLRWSLWQDYCHLEELAPMDPPLYEKLLSIMPQEKNSPLEIAPFVYIISKGGYVKRMTKRDYLMYGWHGRQLESWKRAQKLAMADKLTKITDFNED